jgi:serine/threonine protein kinase
MLTYKQQILKTFEEKNNKPYSFVDVEKFRVDANKLEKMKDNEGNNIILGKGEFGIVYMASYGERRVALKEIEINQKISKEKILDEVRFLMSLRHPNVMNGYGYYEKTLNQLGIEIKIIGIITDCYFRGSLMDKLYESQSTPSFEKKMKWMVQIASAMCYLHSQNKVHRDLKPENIFISDSEDAVLGDFGLSREFSYSSINSLAGTLLWIAPEIFKEESYTAKVDVYSFGIILYEIIFNKRPYQPEEFANLNEFSKKIKLGTLRPNLHMGRINIPDHLINLLKFCWSGSPNDRPSWEKIISILKQN